MLAVETQNQTETMCESEDKSVEKGTSLGKNETSYESHNIRLQLETWPHRPVLFCANRNTTVAGYDKHMPLPIGVPIEVESPLLKGKILLRLRNAKSDDPLKSDAYFDGRKRFMQFVFQGRFKQPVSMADVYVGNVYEKPFKMVPPPVVVKLLNALFRRLAPGIIMDLASSSPRVVTLFAGGAQTFRVDQPGEEPDMTTVDIEENTALLGDNSFPSIKKRKNVLSQPKLAARYQYDPQYVYTFHYYDNVLDLATYYLKTPLGKFDMTRTLNGQPMSFTAMTVDEKIMFDFPVWHERLI